jgi:hypothetical protein
MRRPDDAVLTAVIHAEIIGKKSLGKDYAKYSQSMAITSSNTYNGRIVGINDMFVIQKISPLHTVRHLRQNLPRVPRIGENLRIAYSAGICRLDHNLCHAHKLAHHIGL